MGNETKYNVEVSIKIIGAETGEIWEEFEGKILSDKTMSDVTKDVDTHMEVLRQQTLEAVEKDLLNQNRFCINGNCED